MKPPDPVPTDVRNTSKVSADLDSATESERDDDVFKNAGKSLVNTTLHAVKHERSGHSNSPPAQRDGASRQQNVLNISPESDPDSSPLRSAKKAKTSFSDEDSEEERRQRVAQLKSGSGAGAAKRGTKQPIKRGGKRF